MKKLSNKKKYYKQFLGQNINGYIILDMFSYYDFSTDDIEWCFIFEEGVSKNCNLFLRQNISQVV